MLAIYELFLFLGIILCSGGVFLEKEPLKWPEQSVVISCDEDKAFWTKLKKKKLSVPILTAEAILTGVLRQSFIPDDYLINT